MGQRLTIDDKTRTHVALIKHNGDRRLAAAELGMDPLALKDRIHACPELKARWTKPKGDNTPFDPDVDLEVERRNLPATIGAVDSVLTTEQIETRLKEAEQKIATGLKILPITGEERNLAESVFSFQQRHATAAGETMHGCLSLMAIKMTQTMSETMARRTIIISQLESDSVSPEEKQALAMELETIMRTLPQFMKELRGLGEMLDKKQIAKEQLELKRKEQADNNSKKRGKPGFRPMVAVNVQPGGNVSVAEPPPE